MTPRDQTMADGTHSIREFAALAGVTVRALHHYDRLGLLKPKRTRAGYRVYCPKDFETLEQVVALKFIGMPLSKVKLLLRRSAGDLATALRAQRTVLEQKKRLMEQAIRAIGDAEKALQASSKADSAVFRHIIEVLTMQNKREEWNKQYDGLVQGKIERLKALSPDARAELRARFADLFKEVEGALGEDPASPRAQELASRYVELLQSLTPKGDLDPQLLKMVAAFNVDGQWPAGAPMPEPPFGGKPVWEFMGKALAVRG
jgi:DNA-binding transcriptional MerR regulator